jgi:nitrite reductase/ring-hydroxylating ferredoxin subunit
MDACRNREVKEETDVDADSRRERTPGARRARHGRGAVFRQYWLPAFPSEDLGGPDSDPVRIRLLGEDLIAFRDSSGRVGILANNCPHRGASLFFGRNEENGLRCVYHGWKFDASGACVDMPNEPAESDFKAKVKAVAYPTLERGGVVLPRTAPWVDGASEHLVAREGVVLAST